MSRNIEVKILGDADPLKRSLAGASRNVKEFEGHLGKAGRGALSASGAFSHLGRSIAFASGAFLGAAGFTSVLKQSVEGAMHLERELEKTRAVFGSNTRSVETWSKTTARGFGMSRAEALKSANLFGQMSKALGLTSTQGLRMSRVLTELAPKLALFAGKSPEEASAALAGGLAGRTRALKTYGIVIDSVALKAEAMRLGLIKSAVSSRSVEEAQTRLAIATAKAADAHGKWAANSTQVAAADLAVKVAHDALAKATGGVAGSMSTAAKAQAFFSLVQQQSKAASETWRREQGSGEVQMRKLQAELRDTEVTIGNALLPTVVKITSRMADWLGQSKNQATIQRDVNRAVKTAGQVLSALHDIVRALTPPVRAMNGALGGTKRTFELLLALGIAAKLRAIGLSLGFVGRQAAIAGGEAGIAGMTAKLGPFALAVTGAYLAIDRLSGSLNNLPGANFVNQHLGGNWLNQKLGFGGGSATKPPMATDNIKKGYVTVFAGRTYRWNGSGWTDITPSGKGASASGKSGPITPGLAAVEHAVGGHVNDDFATHGHAANSYHYRGQAADLAVDRGVWAKLYANRRLFAELFGPWGLYHYGVKFYDAKLQADHMNHIHVAYTGGPQAISKMLSGGGGGGGVGGGTGGGGGDVGNLVVGSTPKASTWKGATQATIIAAKASVTSMLSAANEVIGGMAGPMDAIERAAEQHLKSLREHLHPHMTAADLARTKADIAKWGKVLNDEISAQTKAAKRAFDRASKTLFRNFDKETAAGLKALAAPDETPTEMLLRQRQEARDDAQRQQALADAQAAGDAQAVADAQYAIETAALEKQAAAERKAADEKAATDQENYQNQRDDQRQALQDQLDDWNDWLGKKAKSWNQFWAWVKANPNGGGAVPNFGEIASAPGPGSSAIGASNGGGFVQVTPGTGGWSQVTPSSDGWSQVPSVGVVPTHGAALVNPPEIVVNITTQLDGDTIYKNQKRFAARDASRNGGTGVPS